MKYKTVQQALFLSLLLLPVVTLAQFRPLVGIPGITDPSTDLNTYINVLYALSISIAALLAVIKIIIAGVKYMLSDLMSSKQEAKSDIQGALLGLLIVISAVLILNVINPQLTETRLFIAPVDRTAFNNSALGGGGGGPSAPLPPPSTLPASAPVAVETILCPDPTCAAGRAACTARGGTIEEQSFWSRTGDNLNCRLGRAVTLYCPSELNGATQQMEVNCTTAQNSCRGPGAIYTQITPSRASCYTPNPTPINRTIIN